MAYVIVFLAVLGRFAPHPPNFTPVFAALLFGGAYLKRRDFLWYPLALLAASDILLTTQVYHMKFQGKDILGWVAYAVIALMGRWLRTRVSTKTVLAASLAGPTAFFLISNFEVWLGWKMYPASWAGLVACYVAALPFFRNSLVSSALFSGVLFGVHELYQRKFGKDRRTETLAP